MPVTVGPSTLTINHDRQFLISQPNATMAPQDDVGFYGRDTRFVSGYSVTINGVKPLLLEAITVEHFSARHEFMTPELRLAPGAARARNRHRVGLCRHLRRAVASSGPARRPPDHLAAAYGRVAEQLPQPYLPARAGGEGGKSGIEARVCQRAPGLRLRASATGRVACLPKVAAGHWSAPGPHASLPLAASGRRAHRSSATARGARHRSSDPAR